MFFFFFLFFPFFFPFSFLFLSFFSSFPLTIFAFIIFQCIIFPRNSIYLKIIACANREIVFSKKNANRSVMWSFFVYIFSLFSYYFNKTSIAIQAIFFIILKSRWRFIKTETFLRWLSIIHHFWLTLFFYFLHIYIYIYSLRSIICWITTLWEMSSNR